MSMKIFDPNKEPKTAEETVSVKPVAQYDASGAIRGYFMALLGPARGTGTRTLYLAAMHHNNTSTRPVALHATEEECMAEWEAAKPCALSVSLADLCNIGKEQYEEITARKLYRERA